MDSKENISKENQQKATMEEQSNLSNPGPNDEGRSKVSSNPDSNPHEESDKKVAKDEHIRLELEAEW